MCLKSVSVHLLNLVVPNKLTGQELTRMCLQLMEANLVGAMWTLLRHMLARCNLKMNVTATMMVSLEGFVKSLFNLLALINALDMDIAAGDSVK